MEQDENIKDQLKSAEIPDVENIVTNESEKVNEPSEAAEPLALSDQIDDNILASPEIIEEKKERSIFKSILIFVSFFFLVLLLFFSFHPFI